MKPKTAELIPNIAVKVGTSLNHKRFGRGTVTTIIDEEKCIVAFKDGERSLITKFAGFDMTILPLKKLITIAPQEIQDWLWRCERTPQSKLWHPEGNVLIHTKIVHERARQFGNLDYALAALFHDLGKADATHLTKKGTYGAYGHEFISARLVLQFQDWISRQGGDVDLIHDIVINHMKVKLMKDMRPSKQEEFRKKPNFEHILKFSEFDNMQNLTKEELSL